jgi:E3 ubiquitin-protein ligase MARCH6
VAGKPIPRPPEGWDDLGVGGAERHGRWAWGNEHTSEIENSVAVRTPFFNDPAALRRDKISTLAHLTAKMMILLFISWAAISVVVCAVLNIPLHLGHSAMFLLRIPDNRIHDPLAFAIGISLLVPMVGTVAKLLAASNNGVRGVFSLLQNWVRSFKPHQTHEKVKTLSAFFALWLVVCPAVLGFLYYSFVVGISVKSNDWHDHAYDALVNWGTGTLLLNGWAVMCYFQMFTKRFWAEIVFGDGQGNANENQDPGLVEARQQGVDNPGRNADRRGNNVQEVDAVEPKELIWQGKDGAIARAFESIKLFLLGWEWDKLDKFTLLQDCAYPVLQHLAIAFAVPLTAVTLAAPVLIAAERETGAAREIGATAVFRIYAIVSVVVDKVYSSKRSLNRWFQIAHKVARDDRYLVGEILVNYTPLRESIPT